MEIKFKLIDEKSISIIGIEDNVEQEVGCIFTPSGSGHNITNAIQVCGLTEAYDLWGCARYRQPKDLTKLSQRRVIDALKGEKEKFIQSKDIQLMFNMETIPADLSKIECEGCYNNPCTCENKDNHKHISPYNVKREGELQDIIEYLDDGKIHLTYEEREELLKKLDEKNK